MYKRQDYINREVDSSLSGGELKRIEIATILARSTALSIFDEPEAGIDLWSFGNLIAVFENMYKKINGSILIISHQELSLIHICFGRASSRSSLSRSSALLQPLISCENLIGVAS